MGRLRGFDHQSTFTFFSRVLRAQATQRNSLKNELLYTASVLAHFAQTSRATTDGMPAPADLSDLFDRYVLLPISAASAEIMETAAGETLLLTGFFRGQMLHRHEVDWFVEVGQTFFIRAGRYREEQKEYGRSDLLFRMADKSPGLSEICWNLSKKFHGRRDRIYLLRKRILLPPS